MGGVSRQASALDGVSYNCLARYASAYLRLRADLSNNLSSQ